MVTIPANKNVGLIPISISDTSIGEEGKTLILQFVSSKGIYIGEDMTLNVKQVCFLNELQLYITFYDWAEELGGKYMTLMEMSLLLMRKKTIQMKLCFQRHFSSKK